MGATKTPRRRRRAANELVTIYWRDIPAQVTASCSGAKGSWLLEERFQIAIDRAATVAGLTTTDDYVRQWRRESRPCVADPDTAARDAAEELQRLFDRDRLDALVENGGVDPTAPTDRPVEAGGREDDLSGEP